MQVLFLYLDPWGFILQNDGLPTCIAFSRCFGIMCYDAKLMQQVLACTFDPRDWNLADI